METKKKDWKESIALFLNKNSNLILIVILLFAIVIRLKYLTINQAVWYDEAEYLNTAKYWAFPFYHLSWQFFINLVLLNYLLEL